MQEDHEDNVNGFELGVLLDPVLLDGVKMTEDNGQGVLCSAASQGLCADAMENHRELLYIRQLTTKAHYE